LVKFEFDLISNEIKIFENELYREIGDNQYEIVNENEVNEKQNIFKKKFNKNIKLL